VSGEQDSADADADADAAGSRDVVVPVALYKRVTVYSTLLAVLTVVLGFMFLDAATIRGSVLFSLVNLLPVALPWPLSKGALSAVLAATGVGLIGLGAGVYILGTRFRAAGMGTDKSDEDGDETDG
jgi:hypothetical protein